MNDHCEILRAIRYNRYLDLGNGSNKFGKHWIRYWLKKTTCWGAC